MQNPQAFELNEDTKEIYRQLKIGVGHEHVNDQNVFDLIALAVLDGNAPLEQQLREWQSPCSDDAPEARPTIAVPTGGFNQQYVKH